MSQAKSQYVLRPLQGTPEELHMLVDLELKVFFNEPVTRGYCEVYFGPGYEPETIERTYQRALHESKTDSTVRWVAAFSHNGQLAGAAGYHIHATYVPEKALDQWQFVPDWYDGTKREEAVRCGIMLPQNKNQALLNRTDGKGEAHLRLFSLFVSEDHRGVGLGRRLIEWGNRVADALQLPVWVEASLAGKPVYVKCGFEEQEKSIVKTETWDIEQALMRRPAFAVDIV